MLGDCVCEPLFVDMATKNRPILAKTLASLLAEDPMSDTEMALTKRFAKSLHSNQRGQRETERILLPELDGLQGRPDLVHAEILALPSTVNLDMLSACLRSPTKARLLALLRHGAPRHRVYLEKFTGLSNSSIRGHIQQLEAAGLVKIHENASVSLCFSLPWDMLHIVAYEVKISKWRRALHQAIGYRSFAHSSWVVMPTSGAARAKTAATAFINNGIGLVSVDESGSTHIEIQGRIRNTTANRRLYLMAIGVVLSKFLEQQRRLHRRLRPETIESF